MSALLARYPDFLQRGAEFADIQEALEPERLALWQAKDDLAEQLCADTATWGLRYWEEALGLTVELTKDVSFRRSRVRGKLQGVGVTTVALVQSMAENLSGGAVEVRETAALYRVEITFVGTIGTPPNIDELTASLRETMPAHLGWDYILRYLLIRDIHGVKTLAEMGALTLDKFAGGSE